MDRLNVLLTRSGETPAAIPAEFLIFNPENPIVAEHGAQRGAIRMSHSDDTISLHSNETAVRMVRNSTPLIEVMPDHQNRPAIQDTAGELAQTMTEAIRAIIRQDAAQQQTPRRTRFLYTYAGKDYEDPARFVFRLERHFAETQIQDDMEKMITMGEQLTGIAKEWFGMYKEIAVDYNELVTLFNDRFNSPEEVARALSRFYGEKQGPKETVMAFIGRKRQMKERLLPRHAFQDVAPVLINQLAPEIRSRLRGIHLTHVEELMQIAARIEGDLNDAVKLSKAQEAQRTPQNLASPPTRNAPRSNNPPPQNAASRPLNPNGPTSPCRFCRAWHFNAQCPHNPFTQPGNGPRVAREAGGHPPTQTRPTAPSNNDNQQ